MCVNRVQMWKITKGKAGIKCEIKLTNNLDRAAGKFAEVAMGSAPGRKPPCKNKFLLGPFMELMELEKNNILNSK
jgi:hypothetical protein